MIYAKWKLDFSADEQHGSGPDEIVRERGDDNFGLFYQNPEDSSSWIYGYLNDGFDFNGLEAWQITEVTQAEILEKAQELNPECYIDDNGRIAAPEPERP